MTTVDSRTAQLDWLRWAAAHPHYFTYSEGANRMEGIGVYPPKFPMAADCSAFDTWIAWIAGGNDPNGLGFDKQGYTGTFLSHEEHLALWVKNSAGKTIEQVIPADYVVYGPGNGTHVAMIVEVYGNDILTVSHGDSQGPIYTWVNTPTTVPSRGYQVDGRQPQTFLANVTASTRVLRFPPGTPTANPTAAQITAAGLVHLPTPADAILAIKNGYTVQYWNGLNFIAAHANMPVGTNEYASKNYKTPRVSASEE